MTSSTQRRGSSRCWQCCPSTTDTNRTTGMSKSCMHISLVTKWRTVGLIRQRATTPTQTTHSGRNLHTKNSQKVSQEARFKNGRREAISTLIRHTISGNAPAHYIQRLSTGMRDLRLTERKTGTHSRCICYRSRSTCPASICQSQIFRLQLISI